MEDQVVKPTNQVCPEVAAVRLFGLLAKHGPGPFGALVYAGAIWPGRAFKSDRVMLSSVGRMLKRVGGYERGSENGFSVWKYVGIKYLKINIE